MIIIKTEMDRIPETCYECPHYMGVDGCQFTLMDAKHKDKFCPMKELVRCDECKYSKPFPWSAGCICNKFRWAVEEDWFCGDGERE